MDKIFCGSGKVFGKYGQLGITVILDDIPDEYIFMLGDKKAVKLNVCAKRTPNEKSSHYVEVNTWKPDGKKEENIPVDTSFDFDMSKETGF